MVMKFGHEMRFFDHIIQQEDNDTKDKEIFSISYTCVGAYVLIQPGPK